MVTRDYFAQAQCKLIICKKAKHIQPHAKMNENNWHTKIFYFFLAKYQLTKNLKNRSIRPLFAFARLRSILQTLMKLEMKRKYDVWYIRKNTRTEPEQEKQPQQTAKKQTEFFSAAALDSWVRAFDRREEKQSVLIWNVEIQTHALF